MHFDLRLAECGLSFDCRGWVHFITLDFEPGEPQRANACGFCLAGKVKPRVS
jgi:hypothetical protein